MTLPELWTRFNRHHDAIRCKRCPIVFHVDATRESLESHWMERHDPSIEQRSFSIPRTEFGVGEDRLQAADNSYFKMWGMR
jgi:hypothetical protein